MTDARLPGADWVDRGLEDLASGIESVPALLVSIGAPRLRALGVDADERPDGFVVRGGRPLGGTADAAGDHRLVMAFAIVGLGSRNGVTITGAEAVSVSYPGFAADLARLRR